MTHDPRQAIAATRPGLGDDGDLIGTGSTVHRLGPDRLGLSSRPRWLESSSAGRWRGESSRSVTSSVVFEFTAAWERGELPAVEDFLRRIDPADDQGAVDLIYREYCLAEADGRAPDADAYVARFPRHAESLRRLFRVHGACSPSMLARLMGPPPSAGPRPFAGPAPELPESGDSIGPYVLRRELGRGSFARVFLAEQADLANRLVVVKIATRATREPWLLARARHAHIVEIVSHAEVDDGAFQLICMPFWGGATLADVLAAPALASPARARGPAAGAELLAALDKVGAPEFPSVHPARPAREILAPLSYDRAIAWVVARLAEALDHAHSRGVAHGDIKPSNILLSADGSPMLLDFNLAREGAPALDPSGRPIDPGGTLAYMAPERLRALASAGSRPEDDEDELEEEPARPAWTAERVDEPTTLAPWAGDRSSDAAAHVSDLYSLGMVLLEALSGRAPSVPEARQAGAAPARLFSAARAYAAARERPAPSMIADFEAASGRPIKPALRAILDRCLDPDPARRYRRALELAEDLDRWRTDRPLAYAEEPFWTETVPRWVRVRRRKLIMAAASILALGLGAVAMYQLGSNRMLRQGVEVSASNKYTLWVDLPESRAFNSQRYTTPQAWAADDPEAFDIARRALQDYGVIGPDGGPVAGDWRTRDDVRYLPAADREDLELWLMERTYRYALALADRPDAPDDWRQALAILDRALELRPLGAFAPLRDRLAARLGKPPAPRAGAGAVDWFDEHLLGFASEFRSETLPGPAPTGDPDRDCRAVIEGALAHFERALASRPGSFWAHQRAASACFRLGRAPEAANHLAWCLERRPNNAMVHAHLARCLIEQGLYAEAMTHCDRALERAPRLAEVYRTRAYTRAVSHQTGGLAEDLMHFEMFSRVLPAWRWGGAAEPVDPLKDAGLAAVAFPRLTDAGTVPAWRRGRAQAAASGPDEVEARAKLADTLAEARLFPLAHDEFEKILVIQPDHIPARIRLVQEAIAEGRFEDARPELAAVLDDAGLEDYVRDNAYSLLALFTVTRQYLKAGRPEEARKVVEHARELAIRFGRDVGRAHYQSAQVYAVLGASDPDYIDQAAAQLFRSFIANLEFQQWYRRPNPWFDPVRVRIDAALGRLEDPESVRTRMMARAKAQSRTTNRVAGR